MLDFLSIFFLLNSCQQDACFVRLHHDLQDGVLSSQLER